MRTVAIGDLVEPVEKRDPRLDRKRPTFVYVDIGAVSQDTKQIEGPQKVVSAKAPSRARQVISADDVLVSTVRPNLNAVARVGGQFNGAIASTGFSVLRPHQSKLSPSYLYHWVRTEEFVKGMMIQATGQSYPAVSDKIVKASEIPLPPLEEQKRIAGILDQADAVRRLRTRALNKLNTLGQAIFHEMFGDLKANTLGWPQDQSLGEVADVISGITKGRKTRSSALREVPYLAVSNVQDRFLKLDVVKTIDASEEEIERFCLMKGDILLTEGGDPDKLGRGTIWNNELPECIHQNHIFRVRVGSDRVCPTFLSWQLGSPAGKAYFVKLAKQTTGIASINKTQLKGFPVLFPPIQLQMEFETRLANLSKQAQQFQTSQNYINTLFASLQHRAFRGEL